MSFSVVAIARLAVINENHVEKPSHEAERIDGNDLGPYISLYNPCRIPFSLSSPSQPKTQFFGSSHSVLYLSILLKP